MRNFSGYEKAILDKVSQVDPADLITISKFLSDQIFTANSGMALVFIPERGKAILYLKGSIRDEPNRQKMAEFLELVSLIEYLKSERYIHSIHFAATAGLFVMGESFRNISQNERGEIVLDGQGNHIKPSDACWIYNSNNEREYEGLVLNKDESSLFTAISGFASPLAPSQELRDFVGNGYKTKEDLRYMQSKRYTKWALGVAILFGVVSTLLGLLPLLMGCS
jgi:hypothetical protein